MMAKVMPSADRVLAEVPIVCKRIVRLPNLVARFGGDEFVLVLHVSNAPTPSLLLLTEIRNAVSTPIYLEDTTCKLVVASA